MPGSLRAFFAFLQTRGRLKAARPKPPTLSERELAPFLEALRQEQGVAPATCGSYQRRLRPFLAFLELDRKAAALKNLTLADIHRYLRSLAGQYQRRTLSHIVTCLRGFLRFRFARGLLRSPLHLQIDTIRACREAPLPPPVQWSEFAAGAATHGSLDLHRDSGLCRSAIGGHLWTAGVGCHEPDFGCGEVAATHHPNRSVQDALPVGAAADGRGGHGFGGLPSPSPPRLRRAPDLLAQQRAHRAIERFGMSQILARGSRTAGIPLQVAGFRCLRHAFAMRLLRKGASLKGIGDLMGHRSPQSTGAYLRLNVEDLRPVALPVSAAVGAGRTETAGQAEATVRSARDRAHGPATLGLAQLPGRADARVPRSAAGVGA